MALFLVMEKVEFPPPTPARTVMVLYWVMVYSRGHERCRWCDLGFRAVPVGVALFFDNGKGRISTPDPRQDGNGFVLGDGV
jgi:hypothetical protein